MKRDPRIGDLYASPPRDSGILNLLISYETLEGADGFMCIVTWADSNRRDPVATMHTSAGYFISCELVACIDE